MVVDFGPVRRALRARPPMALGARSQSERLVDFGPVRRALAAAVLLLVAAVARAESPVPSPAATALPAASAVEVHGHVEKGPITIGQRFRYTIEVAAPAAVEIMLAQPTERLGDFDIVDFGDEPSVERNGKTVITRWFQLVGYTPGNHLVDSPPVRYRLPGEDLAEAPQDETLVEIASVLAREPNATDIRDVKPPEEPPVDWRPYYLVAGAVAAVLLLGFIAYRVLRRRDRVRAGPPPRPAHEIAHEELARLRARGLPEQGAFKEYYSALTAIVRSYLEQRFRLRAPEMTTEEFLMVTARGAAALQSSHRALLGDFLSESDLVKFARHHPSLGDAERAFGAAARFVDETAAAAPRPTAAARPDVGTTASAARSASGNPERPHASG